jgi:L-rhamnose isomerase
VQLRGENELKNKTLIPIHSMKKADIEKSYKLAKEQYAAIGVDTDAVVKQMDDLVISLHCWQTDDVGGFEKADAVLGGGGIQATGNFPGKARTIEQMRADLDKVFAILPGKQRLSLHAIYGEFGGKNVDRDQIETKHFQGWIDWAKERGVGLDFNCTCFSHPLADDGYTLSAKDEKIRKFWVEHTKRCRAISADMGKQLGTPCVHNIWIPDGSKDTPVDRVTLRKQLKKSLDEIFAVKYPKKYLKDSVESKLWGIGSESMVVGSYDFYVGYAIKNNTLITIDNGHYHPTEVVGDKISSLLLFVDEILLHLTRGVRWDSDHVLTFNEELLLIAQEIIRCKALDRINIGLDFFDASLNRIGAYVIGTRSAQLAFMYAMLEPAKTLVTYENQGRTFERLATLEMLKTMPFGAVYDYYCLKSNVPSGQDYIDEIMKYEKDVLRKR